MSGASPDMVESSGLLLYRRAATGAVEVLIGHMGGPYWAARDEHAWSIPKGLANPGEDDLLVVAEREFAEEMGSNAPDGETIELGSTKSGRKTITIFAREGDFDAESAVSNTFELEWPPRSGRIQQFPEIDQARWVATAEATSLLAKSQEVFIEHLHMALKG